nr:GrBNV_gp13-like protein [Oryctes rhinoceros nudivirus]
MMNAKKRQTILDSISPPTKRKRDNKVDSEDDDDDDSQAEDANGDTDTADDDDADVDVIKFTSKRKSKAVDLKLPGGVAKTVASYSDKCMGSGIGEAPREIVQNVRRYMDVLINSVVLEAKFITSLEMEQSNSLLAIPGVVSSILEYNNISFKTIKYCVTKVDIFEPVWYTYSITKSELILYINEAMYEEFCSKNNNDPVIFTSGVIPIEIYNPYEVDPGLNIMQAPIIHCAIASDHVAQHIIYDIYCTNKVPCADIHEKFGDVGTTLHSMFHLERTCTKMPKREYSNYLTLGGTSSSTPLLKSTQRIIESIIPQTQQMLDNSLNFAYSSLIPQNQVLENTVNFAYSI